MVLVISMVLSGVPLRAQVAPEPDAPPTAERIPATVQRAPDTQAAPIAQPEPQTLPPHNSLSYPAAAENQPSPEPQVSAPAIVPSSSGGVLRVTVNLVDLFFIVRGPHNQPIANLNRSDCSVFEDDKKQTIKDFVAQSSLPLTLGMLLDTSLSQERVLPREEEAGTAFLQRILRKKDEAFLISFDVDATLLADFTGSASRLDHAMEKAHINSSSANYATGTVPAIGKLKGTVLYDAVYLASNEKLRSESGRKALILLTDGEDVGSEKDLAAAIEASQKANATVYVLLIQDSGGLFHNYGAAPMHKLAQATGGRVFEIGGDGRKMQLAFQQIENELRTQYQVTYTPTNRAQDGSYRHIRIECSQNGNNLHVQARQGYYSELSDDSEQSK